MATFQAFQKSQKDRGRRYPCNYYPKESRPLMFIAHILGGLVKQRALTIASQSRYLHFQAIETCTEGICFLGTPHRGVDIAAWGTILSSIVNVFKPANSDIVKFLEQRSPILMEVQDSFHNMLEI